MKRAVVAACVLALAAAAPAGAAIFVRLTTTVTQRGGILRGIGNGGGMPLYVLPVNRVPFCMRHNVCDGPLRSARVPRPPYLPIGRLPTGRTSVATRAFALRLPRTVAPGRYKVFVWCRLCGGTLLVAGTNAGQTLRVLG